MHPEKKQQAFQGAKGEKAKGYLAQGLGNAPVEADWLDSAKRKRGLKGHC